MQSRPEISWFTPPVGEAVGYGYAAISLIHALQVAGVKVSYDQPSPKVHISFVQPDFYHGNNMQYRIGYTPWESSELPKHWIPHMRRMDEIWTTSNYCREVFERYEVNETIKVVPHGIDPIWSPEQRFVGDKFFFLHVGEPTPRKGGQRVVDAFLDVFGDIDDVFLILKSSGPHKAFWDKTGKIAVIQEVLHVEDLVKLYKRCHAMVYPTNGEGFGFIPFQAIASGMPTICTNATGCADFAGRGIPLSSHPSKAEGIHLGDWVEPDMEDLKEKMLYVYENYETESARALREGRALHGEMGWDKIAGGVIEDLGDKIYQRI